MKMYLRSFAFSLLLLSVAVPRALANKESKSSCKEACILCSKVNCSGRKVKEGFVHVPARTAHDGSAIPAAELFFRKQGCKRNRPTLVFIHGVGFSSAEWQCQQEELSKDYQTLAIDLRGSGLSETTNPTQIAYNLELFAGDIHAVLEHFGIKESMWIGHSIGAAIGILYTDLYPGEIQKLALVSASPLFVVPDEFVDPGCDVACPGCPNGDPTAVNPNIPTCWPFPTFTMSQIVELSQLIMQEGFEFVVRNVLVPLFYNEVCQEELAQAEASLVETFLQLGPEVTMNILLNAFPPMGDVRNILPTIDVPTLLTYGTIDLIVPPGAGRFLAAHIEGANLVGLAQKGHVPHVTDFKRFNCILRDFLNGSDQECCVCPLVKPTTI